MTDRKPVPPYAARECGLMLLEVSGVYEAFEVPDDLEPEKKAILGLTARARGLLRAGYRLADAGDVDEAVVFVRALYEYKVTVDWLVSDLRPNFLIWAMDDLRRRLAIADAYQHHLGLELATPVQRAQLQAQLEAAEEEWRTDYRSQPPRNAPPLEQRATAVGELATYSIVYRFDSQISVHPTFWAADRAFSAGRVRELGRRAAVEPYAPCAAALESLLTISGQLVPLLDLSEHLEPIRDVLGGIVV